MRYLSILTFLFSIAVINPAHAGIIASFDFEGSSYASTDTEPLTTASDFLSQATGSNSDGFGAIRGDFPGATSFTAIWQAVAERNATNSFFEFGVSLEPGTTEISFDSLTFDAFVSDEFSGTTAFDFDLFWSVDGFGSAIASGNGPSITGATENGSSSLNFDLSGLASQTAGVTFRLDPIFAPGSGTAGVGTQRRGALDNVILYGTASATSAVPEPSTAIAMGLLGVLGFAGNRRRRRQS